jgi:uncharacterized protein (TIGR00730 family)
MEYNPKHRKRTRETKAYDNTTFLNSRESRHIRVQCEIVEPGIRLNKLGVDNMITFFGSARTKPSQPDYQDAYKLAYKLGEWSNKHAPTTGISSGGGPGIMEAVNKGAYDSGAKSIGMGISLPFEQHNNEYISPDLDFVFHYFFTRKYWCVYLSKAYVMMPGGVGTMDELFEVLTLIQTQKVQKPKPIVLYNSDFWKSAVCFDRLIEQGTISPEDLDLFEYHDDVDTACDYITNNIELT